MFLKWQFILISLKVTCLGCIAKINVLSFILLQNKRENGWNLHNCLLYHLNFASRRRQRVSIEETGLSVDSDFTFQNFVALRIDWQEKAKFPHHSIYIFTPIVKLLKNEILKIKNRILLSLSVAFFKLETLKCENKTQIPGFLRLLFLIICWIFDRSFACLVFYVTKIPFINTKWKIP